MQILSDIHGEFYTLEVFARKNDEQKEINVIQLGDCGIMFSTEKRFNETMNYLNKLLRVHNIKLYVVRGNHDNPKYFDGLHDKSNIKFLPDYTVLEIEGKRILCVGGAISIDRLIRVEGKDWFKDEGFVYDENKVNGLTNIDLVITHTSPQFCNPTKFNNLVYTYASSDVTLLEELRNERIEMTKLYDKLIENGNQIEKWFYGHFHFKHTEIHDQTEFNLLAINEFYKYGRDIEGNE